MLISNSALWAWDTFVLTSVSLSGAEEGEPESLSKFDDDPSFCERFQFENLS